MNHLGGTLPEHGMTRSETDDLVLFVEETYGLSVDRADLVPETFDSVNALVGYVERWLA
jgi:acyl carrier protein